MEKEYVFILLFVFLLTACGKESHWAPEKTNVPVITETPKKYEMPETSMVMADVEMHDLRVGGTHVTSIFDGDKTLLIDLGSAADEALIEAYLEARGISALDCIIYAKRPKFIGLPLSATGAVYARGLEDKAGMIVHPVLPGQGFTFNNARIDFTEDEEKLKVALTYLGCRYMYTLETWPPAETTIEKASVTIQQPSPDGTNTRFEYKPLREILQ